MARRIDRLTPTLTGLDAPPLVEKSKRGGRIIEPRIISEEFGGANFGKPKSWVQAQESYAVNQAILNGSDESKTSGDGDMRGLRLYPYQVDAVKKILWAIGNRNPLRVQRFMAKMACGTGKTTVGCKLSEVVVKNNRKVLIVCPQEELIVQWIERIGQCLGVTALREQAGYKAAEQLSTVEGEVIVVASVQTLRKGRLAKYWPPDFFDLIIHDECDLCLGEVWFYITQYFTGRHVGLTATDKRLDGKNLGQVFEKVPKGQEVDYTFRQAVEEGYLVRPILKRASHKAIDLKTLKFSGQDFANEDLEKLICSKVNILANASAPLIGDRLTLAFTPRVASAIALAKAYNDIGFNARWISGDDPERDKKLADFRGENGPDNQFQILVNCSLVTRGVDVPPVECIVNARPTESEALYTQITGRGMRNHIFPDGRIKDTCDIIDFAWKYQKKNHKLMSVIDLWDNSDEFPIKVRQEAEELMRSGVEPNIEKALSISQANMQRMVESRLQAQREIINATVTELDPLAMEILGVARQTTFYKAAPRLTQQQADFLMNRFKIPTAALPTYQWEGSRMIERLKRRESDGLATYPMVKALVRSRIPIDEAAAMSFEEAAAFLRTREERRQ